MSAWETAAGQGAWRRMCVCGVLVAGAYNRRGRGGDVGHKTMAVVAEYVAAVA